MRVMMHHDADPRCPLVCFGQVVARDPFLLVGRARKPAFRWRDLVGLRVAPAGDVPTPWMTFQDDLQRAGPRPGGDRRAPRAADGAQPRGVPPRRGGRGAGIRAARRSPGERRPRPRVAPLQRARRHRLHDLLRDAALHPRAARSLPAAGARHGARASRAVRRHARARSPTRSAASCRSCRAKRSRASSAPIARAACGRATPDLPPAPYPAAQGRAGFGRPHPLRPALRENRRPRAFSRNDHDRSDHRHLQTRHRRTSVAREPASRPAS